MTERLDFTDVESALAQAWGGSVRLSGPVPFDRDGLDEIGTRLQVEQAPPGAPDKVLIIRAEPGAAPGSGTAHAPAARLFTEWAGLAFFQEICGETTPVPRLYAANRAAAWLVMEDLPGPDPMLAAFFGDDPRQITRLLKRYAGLLGEMNGRARPHIQRFVDLRQSLGGSSLLVPGDTHGNGVLHSYLQILDELGFGVPSGALADIAEISDALATPSFLTVFHGDPNPGLVAEAGGRLRFFSTNEWEVLHALMQGVFIRMHFPNMGQAYVRRFPETVWRAAETEYRAALAADCPAAADDGIWGRNLTAACAFRALRWTWGRLGLRYMLTAGDAYVTHMRHATCCATTCLCGPPKSFTCSRALRAILPNWPPTCASAGRMPPSR